MKSHQLIPIRQMAGFYFPEAKHLFDERERKELKWLSLLQTAYIGARYDQYYAIAITDLCFFQKKIGNFLKRISL